MRDFIQTFFLSISASLIAYLVFPRVLRLTPKVWRRRDGLAAWLAENKDRLVDAMFYGIFLLSLIALCVQALHHYDSFGSWDEFRWNIDRVVLALLGGEPFLPYVADRYNPFVVVFVPLYSLWSDPRIILVTQSIGLGISVLPLYWFARRRIGRPLGLIVAVTYLFSPMVNNLNNGDMFELKFSVPLVALATFFLLRQDYRAFLISIGIALLVKEDLAVIALGYSIFLACGQGKRALGFLLLIAGVGLALLVTEMLYPFFHEGRPFYFWAQRYSYLGSSLAQIVESIFHNPLLVLQQIAGPGKIDYVLYLLAPLVGLPLLGIEVSAIAFPLLTFDLLSQFPQQTDPTQYYQAPLIPFLFFGAVLGLERLIKWSRRQASARTGCALSVLLIVGSQLYHPMTWTHLVNPSYFSLAPHDALGHQLIQQIPAGATVVTQTEFTMWLHGTRAYRVTRLSPHGDYGQADYLFGDSTRLWYEVHQAAWEHWRASGYFETVVEQDGYFLLKRKQLTGPSKQFDNGWALLGYTQTANSFNLPAGFHFENGMTLLGFRSVPGAEIQSGEKLRVLVEWYAEEDLRARYIVLARLQDNRGHVWAQVDRTPIVQTEVWRRGDIIRDQYNFDLFRVMPPGAYNITVSLWDPQTERRLRIADDQGQERGVEIVLGTINVHKDPTVFPASYLAIEIPQSIEFGDIRLLGSSAIPERIQVGGELEIGLYWQARVQPKSDYVITWLVQDATGRTVQEQVEPPSSAFPTSRWHTGEIVLDWHTVILPIELMPGDYTLTISVHRENDPVELNRIKLAVFSVTE